MLRRVLSTAAAIAVFASPVSAQLRIQPFVTGLSVPVAFIQDPTDATVQYVVQQNGHIRVVKSGVVQAADFLDLSGTIGGGGERGLLGLAFEPGDVTDRRFYVYYTNTDGHLVIARFLRSTGNRLVADGLSSFPLQWPDGNRFIPHPGASNHNGGTLAFGPDGFLYIAVGDGGGSNDPFRNAQNNNALLGKMLRIDVRVNNAKGYVIPGDNPFVDNVPIPALHEIWAFGLRNPWKFSFDDPSHGGTGAILIADVGQGSYEEINYEPSNRGGRNYGWVNREGAHPNPGVPNPPIPLYGPFTDPIHEYTHGDGISITGGYVYRGMELGTTYAGRYFYADLTGRVWSIGLAVNPTTGEATALGQAEHTSEFGGTSTLGSISSFGVDASAELYIVGYGKGTIFKVLSAAPAMALDAPAAGVATQPFNFAGWAIDRRATSGPGIDSVHLWAYPWGTGGSPVFLGAAAVGGSRPDVGAVFGSQFTNSGFGQTIRGLAPGNYTLSASGHSSVTDTFVAGVAVNVSVRNNPQMASGTPPNGWSIPTQFVVSGWALDLAAASGTGVNAIHVWAYPSSGQPPLFLGVATYGVSRPDVGSIFGGQFNNSGYTLNVSGVAVGQYQIYAYARSSVSGAFDNAAGSSVAVTNSPLMSVDMPTAGAVVRPFVVRGWAIDPAASSGTGVNAVQVWAYPISGAAAQFLGAATTGLSRPDIGSAFGAQFNNSGYSLNVNSIAAGTYDLVIFARSTVAGTFNNARVVRVTIQ